MLDDKELIKKLGGTKAFAERLGVSPQCVSNWKRRGIPKTVKWDNRELFQDLEKNKTPSDN